MANISREAKLDGSADLILVALVKYWSGLYSNILFHMLCSLT